MAISNETEFKAALQELSLPRQRHVGALFVESVLGLCQDSRVKGAVAAAKRADISDDELYALHHSAKTASVESYTKCGREADWLGQAGHFVAEAAVACVAPSPEAGNPSWNAAMHARMARTCEGIANGRGTDNNEAQQQYSILEAYLKG